MKITQTTNKSRNETTSFDYDEQGYLLTIIGEYTNGSYHGSYKYSYKWSDNYTSVKEYSKGKACYEYSFVDGLARSGNWLDQYEIIAMGFIYDNKSRLSSYDCGCGYSADISWEIIVFQKSLILAKSFTAEILVRVIILILFTMRVVHLFMNWLLRNQDCLDCILINCLKK